MSENPPSFRKSAPRNVLLAGLGVGLLGVVVAAGWFGSGERARVMSEGELRREGAYVFPAPQSLPPFALTGHGGGAFDREALSGGWTLVFFGFTHCPDVCPITLGLLARLLHELEGLPEGGDTRVALVTVDPERDTAERLAEYAAHFHPNILGVTGAEDALREFARALHTPFRKVPLEKSAQHYMMDHGANVALINPDGNYHGFFKSPKDVKQLKAAYRAVRAAWERRS